MATKKTCFVIAPIGEPDSETRSRSDQVLRTIIRPSLQQCGYEALRADAIAAPGLITSQILQHIFEAPLVIADLTERNPNVFYELALRHSTQKPLIQLLRNGDLLPFDVSGMRTIWIDHTTSRGIEKASREIRTQVQAVEAHLHIDTPVSALWDRYPIRSPKGQKVDGTCRGWWIECIDIQKTPKELKRFFSFTEITGDGSGLLKDGFNYDPRGDMDGTRFSGKLMTDHFPTIFSWYQNDALSTEYSRGVYQFELTKNRKGEYQEYIGSCYDEKYGKRDRIVGRRIDDGDFVIRLNSGKPLRDSELQRIADRYFRTLKPRVSVHHSKMENEYSILLSDNVRVRGARGPK